MCLYVVSGLRDFSRFQLGSSGGLNVLWAAATLGENMVRDVLLARRPTISSVARYVDFRTEVCH